MAVGSKVRGVLGELYNGSAKIAALSDIKLTCQSDTFDDSDHDSGSWGSKNTGTIAWSLTADGWYLDGDTNQGALLSALVAGTVLAVEYRPNGTGSGKTKMYGSVVCNKWNIGSPQQGSAPISMEFQGRGALSTGTQS